MSVRQYSSLVAVLARDQICSALMLKEMKKKRKLTNSRYQTSHDIEIALNE